MNQPTLRPAVVPGRPRPAGFRAACLALLSACLFGFASAKADPGQALNFDGIDDKVTIPHRAELNSLPLTVECWFKPTASGSGVSSIVNKYVASSGNGWAIHYAGGQVSGWYYAVPGYVNTTLLGVTVSLNTWHHVAMVVETTGSKLYVDGVLASSAVWSGAPTVATTTQDVTLGEYAGNVAGGKFFPGAIDEVRIWNGARSLAEIQAFKDTEIASMPSCLMAYYKFSEGSADGVNTGVTALPDIANAFADDGTLANFALTGTTGNWTTGPTLTAVTSTYAAAPDINLVGNGNPILDGTTATATGNNTDFGSSLVGTGVPKTFTLENTGTSTLTVSALSFSGANPGDYAVSGITLPATVAANANTTFTVTFTPSAGGTRTATINVVNDDCDESNYDFALTGTGTLPPATALHFDGVNDTVDIPHQPGQLSFPFTVEAWVKTTDSHGLLVSKYVASSGNGWQMGTEGGKLTAWFFRPGGAGAIFPSGSGIVGATTINNDVWHHVAFVVDSTGGRLYVDGVSDGFSGWTWGTPGTATTTAPVRLGDVTMQTVYPFAGTLDEVRIWAVARSAAELQTYKAAELAVMPPCLVGYYKLNHGTVGANNAGVDSAVDETGGASGTLNNFGLTGPTGNWTDGSGITPETSVPDPTAPEINLTGNTLDIALADTTPRPEDDTDFGNAVVLGSPVVRTFTVQNTGPGASVLNVSGISVTGAHPANFVAGPLNPVGPIAGGGSATFTVTFSPSAAGLRSATVTVNNDDCNESAYSFAVQGTGVNTAPTVVATSATITINEGTATSNGLTVNDAENNSVTVTSSVGSIGVLASATYVTEFATTTTPRRFDFDSAGNIYVGNLAGVVTKYDPNGNQLLQFTLASPGVFNDSENFTGIDVDASGNIYVAYSGHTHTRKYDSTGNLIGNFGPPTQQVYIRGGRFGGPSGNYYQLDRSHRLVLVNPSGTELWRTSGYNAGNNEPPNTGLNGNLDVAIHPTTGTAYVGDSGFIKGFDVTGATTGYFNTVGGQNNSIDMDAQGNLWTASATTIRKYTTAGISLGSFGTAGTGAGQFQLVTYLRFDAAGNLWALDQTRNKLIKFNVGQSSYAWLHTPADGPAGPTTVTITATDSLGASGQTTFTLNVNNVAPTATFSRSAATANENTVTPPSVSFTGQVDPGTTDVSTGLKYSYDYNNDGTWDDGDGTYAGSLTAATKTIPANYFASPAPASLTVKGRILDKDGGLTDYTVSITINHAPTAINGPLTIVEDFDYGTSAGTLSGNGGAGFSTAWNGGSYTPTGLTFSSLTSPGGAWNGGSGSRNFAASLAAAGPITGDFLFSMSSAPPGRVQMFGLGGFNNQGFTIALAPANDSTPTGGVPIVGLNSGGYANVTAGAVALNTTYLYRFAYAGSSITVWILSAAQYDNFAPGGLTDAELNAATIGTGATQVTGRVTKVGNVTANMANLFTYTFGGGGVTMDRVRMTGQPVGASLVVAENAAINTSVGTLTPSDADSGNTFTFSLVNGTGDADNASFNISGNTVRSSAVFNYEVRNSYSIRVRVTDQGGLSYETPLTVTISNVNEAVTDVALSPSSIAENNAANATVGTLSATDGDTGDTHTFTLVTGTGSGDNGSFTIAANALKLTPSADFETKSSYALRVRATDAGGLFFEKALTVTITDVAENVAPTVARDAATVTVPEGTTAFNSGTFADANSDTVTITASVGTITQSGAGTWNHQQTLTQGNTPIELTLDSQENLYVVNEGQNKLYKYNSSGSLVTSWTVTGNPTGVAVDSANGWLYVALKGGHRIDKFTLSGTLLSTWGSLGSGNGQFSGPHCVAVDAAGDVYVADSGNNRIQVFSPAGAFLRKWGSGGSGDGLFNFPQGLRISPGGTLYVADRGNNRVQYFDTAGTFLGKWGTGGNGNGQFSSPAGIGIDPGGNIVVGDIFNNRIQKFTATGTFVDKLGPSTTVGNLALPHGTAFPPSGRSVYIADFSNGRVVKFATPGGWNWSYTPADGAAGPTTVTITATDNGSPHLSSTTTFTLNVNNVAPTIALTGNATVPNGTPYTLNLGAITDPGTDTVSAFSINWGDGNTENFTGNPASTSKTHTYATLGAKTITVTLTDEDGTFTGGTRSVTVENAAPVAGADGLNRPNTTKVAKVLKSDLLGNDSDADGDSLTLTAVGNALPAGATVTLAGNFVVYTAPANNAGNGSFEYTLSDGTHSVTGTVTVTETTTSGGGGGTPNYLTLVPSGDDFIVTFLGVPGGSFRVQYSTAGPPNYDWQEFISPAIYTAAPNGVFTHTDVDPPGPVRFYRAVSNP